MRCRLFVSALLSLGLGVFASQASAALLLQVDKSAQTLTVTRDGERLHVWPVSTGIAGRATPSGDFTTFRMEEDHFSKEFDDAPMPHSVFFTRQGHAIHGSFDIKHLGMPASHGCVRLSPQNAATLYRLVEQEGLPNTHVTLSGSEQVAMARLRAQRVARSAPDAEIDAAITTGSVAVGAPNVQAYGRPPLPLAPDAQANANSDGSSYGAPVYPPRYPQPRYAAPQPYYAPQGYAQPGYAQPGYAPQGYAGMAQRDIDGGAYAPRQYYRGNAAPYDAPRTQQPYYGRGYYAQD